MNGRRFHRYLPNGVMMVVSRLLLWSSSTQLFFSLLYVSVYMCMRVFVHVCMCVCVYVWMCAYVHVYMCGCVFVRECMCVRM